MFGNKYLYLAAFSTNIICCMCYVNYELFRGFDPPATETGGPHTIHKQVTNSTTHKIHTAYTHKMYDTTRKINATIRKVHTTPQKVHATLQKVHATPQKVHATLQKVHATPQKKRATTHIVHKTTSTKTTTVIVPSTTNTTVMSSTFESTITSRPSTETTTYTPSENQGRPRIKVREFKKNCPETERPLSIGTYEIPTQRDLVLFTKRTLLKMFNSYHTKTLYLLKDIKEASRATVEVEKKCRGKKSAYRKCVKQVSKKCISITKDLVASLERQEAEVAALTKDKICEMTSMRTDPIQLIKKLAMDEATLDFALPAFLRLLGGCSMYCHKQSPPDRRPRVRQLTDQDLVVRHFLTSKNYLQLLKDTTSYV